MTALTVPSCMRRVRELSRVDYTTGFNLTKPLTLKTHLCAVLSCSSLRNQQPFEWLSTGLEAAIWLDLLYRLAVGDADHGVASDESLQLLL